MNSQSKRLVVASGLWATVIRYRSSVVFETNFKQLVGRQIGAACPPEMDVIESGLYSSETVVGGALYQGELDITRISPREVLVRLIHYEFCHAAEPEQREHAFQAAEVAEVAEEIGLRVTFVL